MVFGPLFGDVMLLIQLEIELRGADSCRQVCLSTDVGLLVGRHVHVRNGLVIFGSSIPGASWLSLSWRTSLPPLLGSADFWKVAVAPFYYCITYSHGERGCDHGKTRYSQNRLAEQVVEEQQLVCQLSRDMMITLRTACLKCRALVV